MFVVSPRTIVGTTLVTIVPLFTTLPVKFPPDRVFPERIIAELNILKASIVQALATSIAPLIVDEATLTVPVVEAVPFITIFESEILFEPARTSPFRVNPVDREDEAPRSSVFVETRQSPVVFSLR